MTLSPLENTSFTNPRDPTIEFHEAFESLPEAKAFMNFFQSLDYSKVETKIQQESNILEKLRKKIPKMKNLEEFKNLYAKTFLPIKMFILILKLFAIVYFRKRRRNKYVCKNEKWKHQIFILFVWIVTEYSFLNHIETESFVILFYFLR